MTTTQISRKDDRTPVYYIGLVREGRKLILQAKESIDDLSCEITDYLGARQVSKTTLEANKGLLLEGFKALPKYRNCDTIVVEEPEEEYEQAKKDAEDWERIASARLAEIARLRREVRELVATSYWLVVVWGDVEAEVKGPFATSADRDAEAKTFRKKEGDEHGLYPLEVMGAKPIISSYTGIFFDEPNEVEEPPAPYYTQEEAEGKWICAYDTMCQGWDCVRITSGDKEDYPFLYESREEVETDDFFDPDDDFAIPAEEFIEGRRFFFGANGCRVEGTPIVKGYKIEGIKLIKVEEGEVKYSPSDMVELNVGYASTDASYMGIEKIITRISKQKRIDVIQAQKDCKNKGYFCIEIDHWDETSYVDEEGKVIDDYQSDMDRIKVYKDAFYIASQLKHNSDAQIESEAFKIDAELNIIPTDR